MITNAIKDRRPNSRFSTYTPETPSQQQALDLAKAVVDEICPAVTNYNPTNAFSNVPSPFAQGLIVAFTGNVGTGKTHLMEAMINEIADRTGPMERFAYLSAGNMRSEATVYGMQNSTFNGMPLVFVDDAFKEYASAAHIDHDSVAHMMGLVSTAYDNKRTIVLTSNFSITDVMLPLMRKKDTVGRSVSRLAEILAEVKIEGPDGRQKIAQTGGPMARLLKKPAA